MKSYSKRQNIYYAVQEIGY